MAIIFNDQWGGGVLGANTNTSVRDWALLTFAFSGNPYRLTSSLISFFNGCEIILVVQPFTILVRGEEKLFYGLETLAGKVYLQTSQILVV